MLFIQQIFTELVQSARSWLPCKEQKSPGICLLEYLKFTKHLFFFFFLWSFRNFTKYVPRVDSQPCSSSCARFLGSLQTQKHLLQCYTRELSFHLWPYHWPTPQLNLPLILLRPLSPLWPSRPSASLRNHSGNSAAKFTTTSTSFPLWPSNAFHLPMSHYGEFQPDPSSLLLLGLRFQLSKTA